MKMYQSKRFLILQGLNALVLSKFNLIFRDDHILLLFQVSLNNIKRCVLLNYDPEKQEIDFRH